MSWLRSAGRLQLNCYLLLLHHCPTGGLSREGAQVGLLSIRLHYCAVLRSWHLLLLALQAETVFVLSVLSQRGVGRGSAAVPALAMHTP